MPQYKDTYFFPSLHSLFSRFVFNYTLPRPTSIPCILTDANKGCCLTFSDSYVTYYELVHFPHSLSVTVVMVLVNVPGESDVVATKKYIL